MEKKKWYKDKLFYQICPRSFKDGNGDGMEDPLAVLQCGNQETADKRLQRLWYGFRDSARTPVQWSAKENAGFTTGKPWFYVNENYTQVNVAVQEEDPNSVLNFYRKTDPAEVSVCG